MRVLILDFDFFSARGGGQTFYRRVVERHPDWAFHYPSNGPDFDHVIRSAMPPNAHPFPVDRSVVHELNGAIKSHDSLNHIEKLFALRLVQVARAVQGKAFDLVETPSFFPVAHFVRPLFAAFGVFVGGVSVGMLGWNSVGIRNAYGGEVPEADVIAVDEMETRCVAGAQTTYTISDLHAAENDKLGPPAVVLDMHDALEEVPPPPPASPGEGPPDLWYVGRLDRNKGPDLFIEIVSRVPRHLYGKIFLTGPDNAWTLGLRWSEEVLSLAATKGLEADYVGELSDEALREQVYGGRTVIVIPSRSDAFNYVALEALLRGCPLVLSKNAGAADFLCDHHPEIAPPIIDPHDPEASALSLKAVLTDYPRSALALRVQLRQTPWPKPSHGFMDEVLQAARQAPAATHNDSLQAAVAATRPLWRPYSTGLRLADQTQDDHRVCVIVLANDDPEALALSLTSLTTWGSTTPSIVVVDDGSPRPLAIREVVNTFAPAATLARQGRQGEGAAIGRGLAVAKDSFVITVIQAGEGLDTPRLRRLARMLEETGAAAVQAAWTPVTAAGFPIERDNDEQSLAPALVFSRAAALTAGGVGAVDGHLALASLADRLARSGSVLRDEEILVWRWP